MESKKKNRKPRKDKGESRAPYGYRPGSLAGQIADMRVGESIYTTQEDKSVQVIVCKYKLGKYKTRRFFAVPVKWADEPPVRLTEVTRVS